MLVALVALLILGSVPAAAAEIATGSMLGPRYKADRFYVRSSPRSRWEQTYQRGIYRRSARGKLMMVRLAQAIFEDERLTKHDFDPEKNTSRAIEALDVYKQHGILAVSLSLQGGHAGYDEKVNGVSRQDGARFGSAEGAPISAFRTDGSLKPSWLKRLGRLLRAADERGMIVCLIYFHPGQDEAFESARAIVDAAQNITDWLIENNFRNVVVDVASEWNQPGYSWDHNRFIPENVGSLVETVRQRFQRVDYTLPIGASSGGDMTYPQSLAQACDVILLHGNGRTPSEKKSRVRGFKSTKRTLWMTEDDNGRETTLANLAREKASADALFREASGWGYMPWKKAQQLPFNYLPGPTSEFTDETPEKERDGAYFRAVLEHVASLVLKKPPAKTARTKRTRLASN